jgi:hypothetical protein
MRARRGEIADEYVEGGEAAVLVGTEVIVLSPLATTLLALVGDDWTDVDVVSDGLVQVFGEPVGGEATAATLDALRALELRGVVELDAIEDL